MAQNSAQPAKPLVNWNLAAATAGRLAPPGPKLSPGNIASAVSDLRAKAAAAVAHVHRISEIDAAQDLRDSEVLVVDRPGWAKANTQSFAVMLDSTLRRAEDAAQQHDALTGTARTVSGSVTGVQLGSILAFLSAKVLGQYDPFSALAAGPTAPAAGRLLLVAPNILTIEDELHVAPEDFRLWVCLHEQTHRVQFAAAPWLREHMLAQIDQLSAGLLDGLLAQGQSLVERAKDVLSTSRTGAGKGLLELLPSGKEKDTISHLTAVMSLLEGHANVVMDGVDASIVPTVKTIRQRFNARGKNRGAIEKFVRSLLGMDAKMRQYSDGARFVRAVIDEAGLATFNRVWEHESHLPTEEEIHQPQRWVNRMRA